jgi:ATP-dependent Clp protease ATP-binding subunit ClpX
MATVEDLDKEALVEILTEPKNALTKQYARMFEMDNVDLVYTPDSLEAIAEQALKRATGARGLRAIMEEVLLNTMYDLPSRDDIEQVLIDRDVVEKKVNPTLVPIREVTEPTERSA